MKSFISELETNMKWKDLAITRQELEMAKAIKESRKITMRQAISIVCTLVRQEIKKLNSLIAVRQFYLDSIASLRSEDKHKIVITTLYLFKQVEFVKEFREVRGISVEDFVKLIEIENLAQYWNIVEGINKPIEKEVAKIIIEKASPTGREILTATENMAKKYDLKVNEAREKMFGSEEVQLEGN